jgi:TonB family protein
MFDKSSTWARYSGAKPDVVRVHLGYVPDLEEDTAGDRRRLRIAVALTLLLHVGLAILVLPKSEPKPIHIGPKKNVYVVQQIKFKPPAPQQQQQIVKPQKKTRTIPIPDPTPDEPEPIVEELVDVPEVDLAAVDDAIYGIPEGGLFPGLGGPPRRVGGAVKPPVKVFGPQPLYTEEARLGRVQGVVILEAVIDEQGDVHSVRVLKGLPLGLSESASDTARQWKFKPAVMDGEPVAVFLNLTVRFSLQ